MAKPYSRDTFTQPCWRREKHEAAAAARKLDERETVNVILRAWSAKDLKERREREMGTNQFLRQDEHNDTYE